MLVIFVVFVVFKPAFFKKEKNACCILMFFSTKLLFKMKLFKNAFMTMRLIYFHDSLNTVAIIALRDECFSGKYAQFSFNTYEMKLNERPFPSRIVAIHFWDKPYQELNFKSNLNSVLN